MTTTEAISLCENAMRKLGYKDKFPNPIISYAPPRGTSVFKRYTFYWKHPGQDAEFASFEVDMETKTIKSVYLRAPAFLRKPPEINIPMEELKDPMSDVQTNPGLR